MAMKTKPFALKRQTINEKGSIVSAPSTPFNVIPQEVLNPIENQPVPIPEVHVQEPHTSTHQAKKKDTLDKWSELRPLVVDGYIESRGNSDRAVCVKCHYMFDDETLERKRRCKCCECFQYDICSECVINAHKDMPFHNIEVWTDVEHRFEPLQYDRIIKNTTREECSKRGGELVQEIEVITDSGKIYTCQFEVTFCSCHSVARQLAEINLWPATPASPKMAFTFGFMKLLNYLMLEGHLSLQAACHTFMWTNGWTPKKCTAIYKKLTNECFEEFRHFLFITNNIIKDTSDCPACLKNGRVFYSLDGNFGLVRKKNSGSSTDPPKHGTKLFLDDMQVCEFVEKYHSNKTRTAHNECSTFQAGDNIRAKNKAKGLDQTGVFGCVCRHGVPKLFLNMKYGERFSYPVYLLQELMHRTPDTATPVIIYDIACKLKSHLENSKDDEVKALLERIDLAVPCWHAYGHGSHCQMRNSTHWKEDCGLTDGEEMERLWAYLREFAYISKEMTPSHRIDLITDGLLHYTNRKLVDIASSLVHRAAKAKEVENLTRKQLDQLIVENNTDDGQKLAYKINKQLMKCAKALRTLVKRYNDAAFHSGRLPSSVVYDEVANPKATIYQSLEDDGSGYFVVPGDVRRQALQLLNKEKRAVEEQALVRLEMGSYIAHLEGEKLAIAQQLANLDASTTHGSGMRAILFDEDGVLFNKILDARTLFQMYGETGQVPNEPPMYNSDSDSDSDSES